jgi:hypothetical protein
MPAIKRTTTWKDWIFENGSYKLVSLFVTLILWVTILGRRDFMLTKDVDVEFLIPKSVVMESSRGERKISVKVSGPRTALKKFAASPGSVTFDLTKAEVPEKGTKVKTPILMKNIEVPFGVKVVSIDPEALEVVLSPVSQEPGSQGAGSQGSKDQSLGGKDASATLKRTRP